MYKCLTHDQYTINASLPFIETFDYFPLKWEHLTESVSVLCVTVTEYINENLLLILLLKLVIIFFRMFSNVKIRFIMKPKKDEKHI